MKHSPSRRAIVAGAIGGSITASPLVFGREPEGPRAAHDSDSLITTVHCQNNSSPATGSLVTSLLGQHARIEADFEANAISQDDCLTAISETEARLAEAKPQSIGDLAALLKWAARLVRQTRALDEEGSAVLDNCAAFAVLWQDSAAGEDRASAPLIAARQSSPRA